MLSVALLALSEGLAPTTHAGSSAPRPYALALDVIWGDPVGPESWREDLERALANEIGGRRCFTSIQRFDPESTSPEALVLRVAIEEYRERSTFGVGIATLQSPNASPDVKQSQFAEIKALFRLELLRLPDGAKIRSKRFADRATHQPRLQEDPRYESRIRFLESVRRSVANFVCKGSARQLEKELARATKTSRPSD